MSIELGLKLKIRAMAYTAAEPIPFFWPMRSFIHHNPLHGLERLPFDQAAEKGRQLFHGRTFLPRALYQDYLDQGKVDADALRHRLAAFIDDRGCTSEIDAVHWLWALLTQVKQPVTASGGGVSAEDIHALLHGNKPVTMGLAELQRTMQKALDASLNGERPIYEVVDLLYGTDLGAQLDEQVIKSCAEFFDEGQSVWDMPNRELGFFNSWRQMARQDKRLGRCGVDCALHENHEPEVVIAKVMQAIGLPEHRWQNYFTRELSRLHGWAGFIRWRSTAQHYHWTHEYPADLVDYLAIRLTLTLALLNEQDRSRIPTSVPELEKRIQYRTAETYLREKLYGGTILPAMAHKVDRALSRGRKEELETLFVEYYQAKREHRARRLIVHLQALAAKAGSPDVLSALSMEDLGKLMTLLVDLEKQEGMIWLESMEAHSVKKLVAGVRLQAPEPRQKRPFVQAMFCIDTRSERIRRHLESAGDYQTFGIAGFFGVPVSFMELGKGSENNLCPVILTPKNLVLELATEAPEAFPAVTTLEHAMHELKESVVTPFVTVEAIGLLFGFDMIGKTLAPQAYHHWRSRLHQHKPSTHLLIDKIDKEQADSNVRAVQRALIEKAVSLEFGMAVEQVTDDMVRELREAALGHAPDAPTFGKEMSLDQDGLADFISLLREEYKINPASVRLQLERLARIGYTLDEQVRYVAQALSSIGLVGNMSRFVLVVGHGSASENNPYESALDCGACGGDHGLVNARVLAKMANHPQVRERLSAYGINIAADTWFLPAMHNTTTDEITLHDLEQIPSSHLVYLDRLRGGLSSAARLCAQERMVSLQLNKVEKDPASSYRDAQRNAMDWSQVRPEWGLSKNVYFIIGRRDLTQDFHLDGRAFLHSYDYRVDPKQRLLENILTGPLVVGQWINMEHYFSAVDAEAFGSGSKVYHNVVGRFGVMTGNLSDLRTGLPSQTVLDKGKPFHEPMRLITLIEAPFADAERALLAVTAVKRLVRNGWIRMLVLDPQTSKYHLWENGAWTEITHPAQLAAGTDTQTVAS